MALVRVKEKAATDGAEPVYAYVDEAWLERWPDDYELAPEAPAEAAPAPAPAPTAEAPAEPRRRSNPDF